ncbi:amidase [Hyalangium sp.]|uniref:amidase n=1 Tax=Hyalangium sp. TaxID=2028555 RepID=UPI002D56845E|nr:amidase [Hyalangium sp.]HYH99348.1 amidase [Hyalangium sp.]
MHLREYVTFDGVGLAELVRRREVKPEELVRVALLAIETVNPSLNAVIGLLEAETQAVLARPLPEGPFTGVPFLVKDLVLHMAGVPTDLGSRLFRGMVAPHDTTLMERFRRAGVIPIGRTNAPELGFSATTEPVLHGPTRNPWNPEYSTGGSSGGSGAAVSAGMVPVAYANDGGGSIRIPASLCGLFGLKPTRGRTPSGPDVSEGLNGLGVEHVLSRSVRDSAAMLDATQGPDVGDRYTITPPERPYLEEVGREPGRLRIALTRETASGAPVSPECVTAVEEAAKLCRELGHEVVEATPGYRSKAVETAMAAIWSSGTAALVDGLSPLVGRTPGPDVLEASVWATVLHGRELKAVELQRAFAIMNHVSREVGRFFLQYDVLLTPTLPVAPFRLGVLNANAPTTAEEWMQRAFAYCAFTAPFNLTGQPAMSVPLYWSAEGLPVGVQFVGRFEDEATLFRLAGQLERARPWAQRTPRLHAANANAHSA